MQIQNYSNQRPLNLIFHNQKTSAKAGAVLTHENVRNAVRAWASADGGQECVAAIIVQAWQERGGSGLSFPDDIPGQKQKLFRWLDGDSPRYQKYVQELTPAIVDVLPLEFRGRLVDEDNKMTLLASAEKELAEAKQALMLDAPRHQMVKEVREGIESLLKLLPVESLGPVLSGLASVAPDML